MESLIRNTTSEIGKGILKRRLTVAPRQKHGNERVLLGSAFVLSSCWKKGNKLNTQIATFSHRHSFIYIYIASKDALRLYCFEETTSKLS